MQILMHVALSNVVLAAALALAAAVISRYAKNRRIAHLLWLLVLVKLVTPPLWSVSLPIPQMAIEATRTDILQASSTSRGAGNEEAHFANQATVPSGEALDLVPQQDDLARPPKRAPSQHRWSPVNVYVSVARVWLATSLLCAVVVVVRILRFHRLARRAASADGKLLERVRVLAKQIGLRRIPEVRQLPGIVSPMVWPLTWRRMVLLPERLVNELNPSQLDTVIAHELAHLVRRDDLVRFLEAIVTCCFWWNPIVWWSRRELHAAEEDCCDAMVVCLLPESRRHYGEALLRSAEVIAFGRSLPVLASAFGQQRFLKRRIEMILNHDFRRAASWRAKCGMLILALIVLPLAATAISQDETNPDALPSSTPSATSTTSEDNAVSAASERAPEEELRDAWTEFLVTLPKFCREGVTNEIKTNLPFSDCRRCHDTQSVQHFSEHAVTERERAGHDFASVDKEVEQAEHELKTARQRVNELKAAPEDNYGELKAALEDLEKAMKKADDARSRAQMPREYRPRLREAHSQAGGQDELESAHQRLRAAEDRIESLQKLLAASSHRDVPTEKVG